MAAHLFDTSALVKYYHTEIGSQRVIDLVDDPKNVLFISRLTIIEIHSVFAKRVRNGELTPVQFDQVRRLFFSDLRRRKFHIVRLTLLHERQAMRLLAAHGLKYGLRTLDALQLSVALDLRER